MWSHSLGDIPVVHHTGIHTISVAGMGYDGQLAGGKPTLNGVHVVSTGTMGSGHISSDTRGFAAVLAGLQPPSLARVCTSCSWQCSDLSPRQAMVTLARDSGPQLSPELLRRLHKCLGERPPPLLSRRWCGLPGTEHNLILGEGLLAAFGVLQRDERLKEFTTGIKPSKEQLEHFQAQLSTTLKTSQSRMEDRPLVEAYAQAC